MEIKIQPQRIISELPIEIIPGIGEAKKKVLNKIDIKTVEDLLYYFPRRYVDRSIHDQFFLQEGYLTLLVKIQSSYLAHGKKSRLVVQCRTIQGNPIS